MAKQEVVFGGVAESLTITHDTVSADAYRYGIETALHAVMDQDGLVVGLDRALGVDSW